MPVPNIPAIMNGEVCPGCRTPIWGMRPKKCFICGYDFENPREEDLLENRTRREAERMELLGDALSAQMDRQREQEEEIKKELGKMVEAFLSAKWPPDRNYAADFETAVHGVWPHAVLRNVEVWVSEVESDQPKRNIRGVMDRPDLRIVGFEFEGQMAYNPYD